jgi:nitrile hydratase subunit beta
MNGVHDLGGMDGFGRVDVEMNEPVFHEAWERLVFGLDLAMVGQRLTNVHAFRHAIERMAPTLPVEATDRSDSAALPCS